VKRRERERKGVCVCEIERLCERERECDSLAHKSFQRKVTKSLPWPLDIHGSKISFYRNIFLSQYCASKCLVWIRPKERWKKIQHFSGVLKYDFLFIKLYLKYSYKVFHRFGQAKFAYGGSILCRLNFQFSLLSYLP